MASWKLGVLPEESKESAQRALQDEAQ